MKKATLTGPGLVRTFEGLRKGEKKLRDWERVLCARVCVWPFRRVPSPWSRQGRSHAMEVSQRPMELLHLRQEQLQRVAIRCSS